MTDVLTHDNEAVLTLTVTVSTSNETVVKLGNKTLGSDTSIKDLIDDTKIQRVKLVTEATIVQGSDTYDVSGTVSSDQGVCPSDWFTENGKLKLEVDVPSSDGENQCTFVISTKNVDPTKPVTRPADPILIVKKRGGGP